MGRTALSAKSHLHTSDIRQPAVRKRAGTVIHKKTGHCMQDKYAKTLLALCVAGVVGTIAGCGGGGGGGGGSSAPATSTPVTAATVSGTVAYGAAMSGANVTLTDANGAVKTTTAAADGSYSFDVTGLTAPFLLTASGISGDTLKTYSALLATAPAAGVVANVNVTPLSDAIVAMASSTGNNPAEFLNAGKLKTLDTVRLAKAEAALKTLIANVASDAGLPAGFNAVTTPFIAALGQPGDKLLEALKVSITDSGVTLTNVLVPLASSASGASATVTVTDVASFTATALPKPTLTTSFNTLLTSLVSQLNKCLALAPSARVTLDSNSNPTALLGACSASSLSAFDTTYLSNGYDLFTRWGTRFRDIPAGATVGQAELLGSFAHTDGTTGLSFRLPIKSGDGGFAYTDNIIADTTGAWKMVGNQRKYDFSVTARLYKLIDVSVNTRTGNGPVDGGKDVGRMSHYESALQLSFNGLGPNAGNVYAVRVKGPGLPAAGYVLSRSSTCGSGSLSLYSADGSLPDATGKTTVFTSTIATTGSWRMAATPIGSDYKGTDLWNELRGWSFNSTTGYAPVGSGPNTSGGTASNYSPTQVDLSTIPDLATYTWEIYSIGSATPEVMTSHLTDRVAGAKLGQQTQWPTLTAAALKYVDPTSNVAGELDNATLSWTTPPGTPFATSANLSYSGRGSNGASARGSAGENVIPLGGASVTVAPKQESDGLGNTSACLTQKILPITSTAGSRNLQITQTGNRVTLITEYDHNGRAPRVVPTSSGLGLNYFKGDVHPLAVGSTTLADGTRTEFALNGVFKTSYSSTTAGVLSLDTTATPTDQHFFETLFPVVNNVGTYPKTLTVVAGITGDSGNPTSTQRVIDLNSSFSDAGSLGYKVQLIIGGGGLPANATKVQLNNVVISPGGSPTIVSSSAFNASVFHTYQIAITLTSASAGTVAVYLDGNSTPILSQPVLAFPQVTEAGENNLRFGDTDSSNARKGSLDWLVWSNTGAYTPAQLFGKLPTGLGVTTGY
jgi:hypothetical protein